jgi:2-oxoglutarate dehydrogenase E2 component (dihydrolipoamide succinyltransferase)
MIVEIKIPSPGESISEVEIGKWFVEDGAMVTKDQEIAEIESDKATLSLIATVPGAVKILIGEGERVQFGAVACNIDTEKAGVVLTEIPKEEKSKETTPPKEVSIPVIEEKSDVLEIKHSVKLTPAAKAVMEREGLSIEDVINGLKRLTRQDVENAVDALRQPFLTKSKESTRDEDRIAMSPLRRKLSQRLVAVKNETAMLTTFNEIDMSNVMELRKAYQQKFLEKHGLKLGFMSFFTKAVSLALIQHPSVNSMIDGEEIITPKYHDVGIAVQTPKGLMVPIVRNAEVKSVATIERDIKELADKARDKKLSVPEMTGGTFTITNGGVFGSLMSTPIINPPQSAILGMHSIKERPVAVNGKVEIRPMMYVALSYDHRIIDGKDSVGFLVKVKEMIENPLRLLYDGKTAEELLLEI